MILGHDQWDASVREPAEGTPQLVALRAQVADLREALENVVLAWDENCALGNHIERARAALEMSGGVK